jgi:Zn-dependent peptidase ImmA (M78 family)
MRQIKVPFLRSSEIDHAVADLLRRYGAWRNAPAKPPIDVDEIVEGYLGLVLEIADLKSLLGMPDVLGATWFETRKVCVDQSLEGKEGRFAFTVAHEIGHWQLHRPLLEMERVTLSLFPAAADAAPTVVCRARESKAPAEWQADQFAARLLMPATAVQRTALAVGNGKPIMLDQLDAGRKAGVLDSRLKLLAEEVIATGNFINVSKEAMCYRLLDLKLVIDSSQTGQLL